MLDHLSTQLVDLYGFVQLIHNIANLLLFLYTEVLNIITFDDDDELWNEHPSMMPLSASVHSALVNRIITIAQLNNIDVGTITNSREPSMQDWNSIANIFITTNHFPDVGKMA